MFYHSSPVSAMALDCGSNTKSKRPPVLTPQTQMAEWMSDSDEKWSWNRKKTCSKRTAEMCFLEHKWFSPGLQFHDFPPLQCKQPPKAGICL